MRRVHMPARFLDTAMANKAVGF